MNQLLYHNNGSKPPSQRWPSRGFLVPGRYPIMTQVPCPIAVSFSPVYSPPQMVTTKPCWVPSYSHLPPPGFCLNTQFECFSGSSIQVLQTSPASTTVSYACGIMTKSVIVSFQGEKVNFPRSFANNNGFRPNSSMQENLEHNPTNTRTVDTNSGGKKEKEIHNKTTKATVKGSETGEDSTIKKIEDKISMIPRKSLAVDSKNKSVIDSSQGKKVNFSRSFANNKGFRPNFSMQKDVNRNSSCNKHEPTTIGLRTVDTNRGERKEKEIHDKTTKMIVKGGGTGVESITKKTEDNFWMIPRKSWAVVPKNTLYPIHLRQDDYDLYRFLLRYVPSREQLEHLGYPLESLHRPHDVNIFKQAVKSPSKVLNDDRLSVTKNNNFEKMFSLENEKLCIRCGKGFYILKSGGYFYGKDICKYHWGKVGDFGECKNQLLSCCGKPPTSEGCAFANAHVWSGLNEGMNLQEGFVRTRFNHNSAKKNRILGLDCEMCFTVEGFELVKVAIVDLQGKEVYYSLVYPESEVVDFNTRFSGVTEKDYDTSKARTLREVQNDILDIINIDSIIIGHGLENDLRVLKMIHYIVIDTAIIFPHIHGLPSRRSLKELAEEYLKKQVQTGSHSPLEDAKICVELVLEKLRQDENVILMV